MATGAAELFLYEFPDDCVTSCAEELFLRYELSAADKEE